MPILAGSPQRCLKSITVGPSTVPPSMRGGPPHDTRDCGPYSLRIVCGFFKTSYSIYVWALEGCEMSFMVTLQQLTIKTWALQISLKYWLHHCLKRRQLLIIPDQQLTTVRKKSDIIEEWPASKSNFNEAMIEINFTTRCLFLWKYTTVTIVHYHGIFAKNQNWPARP